MWNVECEIHVECGTLMNCFLTQKGHLTGALHLHVNRTMD